MKITVLRDYWGLRIKGHIYVAINNHGIEGSCQIPDVSVTSGHLTAC